MSWFLGTSYCSASHRKTGMPSSIVTRMKDFNGEVSLRNWKPSWMIGSGNPSQNGHICLLVARIREDWSGWWYFRETLPHIYIYIFICIYIYLFIYIYNIRFHRNWFGKFHQYLWETGENTSGIEVNRDGLMNFIQVLRWVCDEGPWLWVGCYTHLF